MNSKHGRHTSGVASVTFNSGPDSVFLSLIVRIPVKSVKPSAQRGRIFRRPLKPAKSTLSRILTEMNMNSKSTKSTNRIGPNQLRPEYF